MEPVYALLESKDLVPVLSPELLGVGADRVPTAAKKKGRAKEPAAEKPKKKKPPPKNRRVSWEP